MSVSNENKMIARTELEAFGGKPSVIKYWDEKKESAIDILASIDRPYFLAPEDSSSCNGVNLQVSGGIDVYTGQRVQ